MPCEPKFFVKVFGAFDVIGPCGMSLRPSGRKECAILAMLALTRNHRQTRTWLQSMLWGDRAPAQAAGSLRQSLTVMRSIFNAEQEIFCADRTWVWLKREAFSFDFEDSKAGDEILRGFDLREEGFNDWLREIRASGPPTQYNRRVIRDQQPVERRWFIDIPLVNTGDEQLVDIGRSLVDGLLEAASAIGLRTVVDRSAAEVQSTPLAADLIVRSKLTRLGNEVCISVSVTNGFGVLSWLTREEVEYPSSTPLRPVQMRIAQQFQDQALRLEANSIGVARWSAHANGCQALLGLLAPGSVDLDEVARCSEAALSADEQGIYHALLGHAHTLLFGERQNLGSFDIDAVMQSLRTAVRLSPGNGLVQALAGHCYGFGAGDLERNAKLTKEAVRLSPGSGPAWIFHAISLIYNDRIEEANRAAGTAAMLCRGTAIYPLSRSTQLFARLMAGDAKGAIRCGEEAVDGLVYRPTVVDLMTAYALEGRVEDGRRKLAVLEAREPDLSLGLLESPDYPIVNPKHRTLVVDAARRLGLK